MAVIYIYIHILILVHSEHKSILECLRFLICTQLGNSLQLGHIYKFTHSSEIHPINLCCYIYPLNVFSFLLYVPFGGRDSSVGIVTRYGLGDPGIRSRWGWDFPHPSRPAPGPPNLLYDGYRVFPGGKVAGAWCWPPSPSSVPRS